MKKALSDKNKDFKLPEQPDFLSSRDSFDVPGEYFSHLQDQINKKIELISTLENSTGDSHFKEYLLNKHFHLAAAGLIFIMMKLCPSYLVTHSTVNRFAFTKLCKNRF